MNTDISEIRNRVKVGCAELDSFRENWFKKIDLDILDMDRPLKCIIGQLKHFYDEIPYSNMLVDYGFNLDYNENIVENDSTYYNDIVPQDNPAYAKLGEIWKEEISLRLKETVNG